VRDHPAEAKRVRSFADLAMLAASSVCPPLRTQGTGSAKKIVPQVVEDYVDHVPSKYRTYADELSGDAIQAAIRVMEITFPESHGRPAVLDVRRGQLHHRRRRSSDFDAWLASEASAFLAILASITKAA
jgi:hypothetical protein